MVKFTAIIHLKPGYDSDETWDIWCNDHAPRSRKVLSPEIRKYTLHRVVKRVNDNDVWGFALLEFDDLASAERAMSRTLSLPPDAFRQRVAKVERVIVEAQEIK